jgi:hypothetical protein
LRAHEVLGLEAEDALREHVFRPQPRPERELRQQAQLLRRVAARDVERGVRLGIPEPLRLRERLAERLSSVVHRREDVVGGAVHDAVNRHDPVGGERLAQRADDRDSTADRALVVDVDALLHGEPEDLVAA